MSLAELLVPALERARLARLRLAGPLVGATAVAAPDRRLFRVDGPVGEPGAGLGDEVEAHGRLGALRGAAVLAPWKGKVVEVRHLPASGGSGPGRCIVLEKDPEAKGAPPAALPALSGDASREALLERFDELGVVEYGREAEPLGRLLGGKGIDAVVVTGADREPLLSSSSSLLLERLAELPPALALVGRAAGTDKVFLAVPASLAARVEGALEGAAKVVGLPERYPSTLPELAARRAAGAEGSGRVAVLSVESALAAQKAAAKGAPTFERRLTVVAADERQRKNVTVALGTPLSAVLEALGFRVEPGDRVLSGGPMRGRAEIAVETGVDVETDAVVVVPAEAAEPLDDDPCIGCGSCVEVCPQGLQPQWLGRNAEFGFFERNLELAIESCIRCGMCAYVCPSARPLLQWIELSAFELAKLDALEGEA